MRRPDDALFLDMLVHARRVAAKVSGVSRSNFDANDDLQLALVYLIQVIGEAASRDATTARSASGRTVAGHHRHAPRRRA